MLRGEPEEAGVLVDGLLSFRLPEPLGSSIRGSRHSAPSESPFLRSRRRHAPNQLLGLRQVEGNASSDIIPLGEDALGNVPDDEGLGRV